MIYLDSAATSFHKPPQVAEAVAASFQTLGNAGRGAHAPTLNASRLLYDTREKLAALFHAEDASCICFAANATQALNTVIAGLFSEGDHVITTVCEHNSVLRPLYRKEKEGVRLTILPADEKGRILPTQLEEALAIEAATDVSVSDTATSPGAPSKKLPKTAIVIHHASNVTGNVNDLLALSTIAHRYGALLIVDAAQTAGSIPIDVQSMGIDVLCFTGHKGLMGPQGTGGLYVKPGITMEPLLVGGSGVHSFSREHPCEMPTALEAGTANAHGIAGLNASLSFLLETGVDAIQARERELKRDFIQRLRSIPELILYGDVDAPVSAPIISLNIKDWDAAAISDSLWEDSEICVRAGAHCAPLMHQHFGTEDQGMVRFSLSYYNTPEEIDAAVKAIRELVEE